MAYIQGNFYSSVLSKNVSVDLIIPTIDSDEALKDNPYDYFSHATKFQTVYLLNSEIGDRTEWQRYSTIEQFALLHRLAVVMPSVVPTSCCDDKSADKYERFVTCELIEYLRKVFPLSQKRENTFIAGVSLGGVDALAYAVRHPDKYSHVAAFSAPLDHTLAFSSEEDNLLTLRNIEPDLSHADKSLKMLTYVGSADTVKDSTLVLAESLKSKGIDLDVKEFEGTASWRAWDGCLYHLMDWLPLTNEIEAED